MAKYIIELTETQLRLIANCVEVGFAIILAILLFGSLVALIWIIGLIIKDDIHKTIKK